MHEFCSVSGSSSTHTEAAVTQAVQQSYRLVELPCAAPGDTDSMDDKLR